MRRLLASVIAVSAIAAFPAHAVAKTVASKSVTFAAATPCFAACSYWTNPADPTRQVEALEKSIVDGDDSDFDLQTSYACTAPGPQGSFRDIVLTAPKGADHIKVVATPDYDWDLALCAKPATGNNGKLIAFEEQAGGLPNYDNPDQSCAINCTDTLIARVAAGKKYVLRAYAWMDINALRARIYWQDW